MRTDGIQEDPLVIDQVYCGPPDSAHGGVAVGRFAELVGHGPLEVRLLGPPPLGTPLSTRTESDDVVMVSGPEGDLARVRTLPGPVAVDEFGLVSDDEIASAAAEYLQDVDEKGHPFPTCFGCGPDRRDQEALRQFSGRTAEGDTIVARFTVAGDGPLPDWLIWAGLDCPSARALSLAENAPSVAVLGSMRGQLRAQAHAGTEHQVRGRLLAVDGRKHIAEVAMLAPDGRIVAEAQAVWIAVDGARFSAAPTAEASR